MAKEASKKGEVLKVTHVYLFGVGILAVMAAILIAQRSDMWSLGSDIVKLEGEKSELFELQRKLNSKVESCRSVKSLEEAMKRLNIELEPRPVTPEEERSGTSRGKEGTQR